MIGLEGPLEAYESQLLLIVTLIVSTVIRRVFLRIIMGG